MTRQRWLIVAAVIAALLLAVVAWQLVQLRSDLDAVDYDVYRLRRELRDAIAQIEDLRRR